MTRWSWKALRGATIGAISAARALLLRVMSERAAAYSSASASSTSCRSTGVGGAELAPSSSQPSGAREVRLPPLNLLRDGIARYANHDDFHRHLVAVASNPHLALWTEGWIGMRLGSVEVRA